MDQVVIFVHDYKAGRKLSINYTAEDYARVEKVWHRDDDRLLSLQAIPAFRGYTAWKHCRTEHFRILIARTMMIMSDLSREDQIDPDNPAVDTFNFLALSLVKHIEETTLSSIESLRITRIEDMEILFSYSATMDMSFGQPPPRNETIDQTEEDMFKIVIDNTKADK